ncbi:unnamed protein product, partial [Peniophora sp. CBMAI 1063]
RVHESSQATSETLSSERRHGKAPEGGSAAVSNLSGGKTRREDAYAYPLSDSDAEEGKTHLPKDDRSLSQTPQRGRRSERVAVGSPQKSGMHAQGRSKFKAQGHSIRLNDASDEALSAREDVDDESARKTSSSRRQSRAVYELSDDDAGHPRTPSAKKHVVTRPVKEVAFDISKSYLSPPPTNRKAVRVPDTPRGKPSRRISPSSPAYRSRSPIQGHRFYAMASSDEDLAIQVRSRKRSAPLDSVVEISTDEELPTRLTPKKKRHQPKYLGAYSDDSAFESTPIARDSDVDERGNIDGLIASDDDDMASSPRKSKAVNGAEIHLKRRSDASSSSKSKRRLRSPSFDASDYEPSSRKASKAKTPSKSSESSHKRKYRSPTPPADDDRRPAKRAHPTHDVDNNQDALMADARHAQRDPSPHDRADKQRRSPSPINNERPSAVKAEASATAPRPLMKDGKCKVTREEDHDGFLVGTYGECAAYLTPNMLKTPQETGAVGVSHFGSTHNGLPRFEAGNLSLKRLRAMIKFLSCADGFVVNPARIHPDQVPVSLSTYTTGNNKTIKTISKNGETLDLVIYAFVAPDGSYLDRCATPSGSNAPTDKGYRCLNVFPLNGEFPRILAFMHHCFSPANQQCQMFTNGNAWQATSMWGDRDKYQGRKPLPEHVRVSTGSNSSIGARGVHPSLARVVKSFNADIPVFDSRRHFLASHVGEDWKDGFSVEKILTQADGLDERWKGEIPDDSLIALHCVCSMRVTGAVSLNLIGAQVLVTPRVVHFSDL